jgi:hypothetical protein
MMDNIHFYTIVVSPIPYSNGIIYVLYRDFTVFIKQNWINSKHTLFIFFNGGRSSVDDGWIMDNIHFYTIVVSPIPFSNGIIYVLYRDFTVFIKQNYLIRNLVIISIGPVFRFPNSGILWSSCSMLAKYSSFFTGSTSQIRIVVSAEPETIWVPSGEKFTDITEFLCPVSSWKV